MTQEFYTNTLRIYQSGELKREILGELSPRIKNPQVERSFELKTIESKSLFPWLSGPNTIQMTDIDNLDQREVIVDLWTTSEYQLDLITPINIVFNIKPEKLLLLGLFDNRLFYLKAYEIQKKKWRVFKFEDYKTELNLDQDSYLVRSIEKSQRTNVLFAAIQNMGRPSQILQIKIGNEGLNLISSTTILIEDFEKILKIRSYQIGKNDYLLVNGSNSIVIVKNEEKSLSVVHVFPLIFNGDVIDSCILKNKIFSISYENNFINEHNANDAGPASEKKEESGLSNDLSYDKYNVTKIKYPKGKYGSIEVNLKGNILYLSGLGILPILDLGSHQPMPSKVLFESKRMLI